MNGRRFIGTAFAPVFIAVLHAQPASAQAPLTPPAPPHLTAEDIQILSPKLPLFRTILALSLRFEDRDGTLFLTQTPGMQVGPPPDSTILWSGKFGTDPLKFTLETTDSEEDLKDSAGKVIWSQRFEEPSLTLDIDAQDHVRLTNNEGEELGFVPTDETYTHASPTPLPNPFYGNVMKNGSIRIVTDTLRQQTTITSGAKIVWSGQRPANDGVRFRYSQNPDNHWAYGIAAPMCPPGTLIAFTVTRETGTVSVTEGEHTLVDARPVDTMNVCTRYYDAATHLRIANTHLPELQTAKFAVFLNAPGRVLVEYHPPQTTYFTKELINATTKGRGTPWSNSFPPSAGTTSQPLLYVWRASLDKKDKLGPWTYDAALP